MSTSNSNTWTSKGRWDTGEKRIITNHMQFDPKDPTVCVAAGEGGRKFEILGDGKALLSGTRSRIYIFHNNYNSVLQLKYVPKSELNSLSLKLRSRHNEEDPKENRFGGYQCSISLERVSFSRENYHNNYVGIQGTNLEKKLENGKEYTVRYTCKDTADGKVNLVTEINYSDDGKGFIKVCDHIDKAPLPYMINKDLCFNKKGKLPSSSYAWIRVNGKKDDNDNVLTIPKNIRIRDVSITPII